MKKRYWISILLIAVLIGTGLYAYGGSITKGLIGKEDIRGWDGVTDTFTRASSDGYTLTLNRLDWAGVDVLKEYGGGVNRTNATITSALAAIGAVNKVAVWLSPGTWTFLANIDWSAYTNVTFDIPPGVLISHGAYTVNIPNPDAGLYQWLNGTGLVTFSGVVKEAVPQWFGAYNDGTNGAANVVAINKLTATCKTTAIPIYFPAGDYAVNASLDFTDANQVDLDHQEGWIIRGAGRQVTRIIATLGEAYAVIDLSGSQRAILKDLQIDGINGGSQTCGVLMAVNNSGRGHEVILEDVLIDGYYDEAAVVNGGSDQTLFQSSYISNTTGYGAVMCGHKISTSTFVTITSKFSGIDAPPNEGNTYINNFNSTFGTYTSSAFVVEDFAYLNDHGSYYFVDGTGTIAIECSYAAGYTGHGALNLNSFRIEADHSAVDATGIEITDGEIVGGMISGYIGTDTVASYCMVGDFYSVDINVTKYTVINVPLIYGNAKNCIIRKPYGNSTIANYGVSSGSNIILGNNVPQAWDDFQNLYLESSAAGQPIYWDGFYSDNRRVRIGNSTTFGRKFSGVLRALPLSSYTTVAGGAEVLSTYDVPVNALWASDNYNINPMPTLRVEAWGTTSADANAKTITVNLERDAGGDTVMVTNDITANPNNLKWKVTADISVIGTALVTVGQLLLGAVEQSLVINNNLYTPNVDCTADTYTIEVRGTGGANEIGLLGIRYTII